MNWILTKINWNYEQSRLCCVKNKITLQMGQITLRPTARASICDPFAFWFFSPFFLCASIFCFPLVIPLFLCEFPVISNTQFTLSRAFEKGYKFWGSHVWRFCHTLHVELSLAIISAKILYFLKYLKIKNQTSKFFYSGIQVVRSSL